MIELAVVFCLVQNPYICRTLPMVPDDGGEIKSVGHCLRGGAIGGMNFTLDHAEWQIKGWRCTERPMTDFEKWKHARRK